MNSLTLSTSTTPLPESWVTKLFHRMLLAYGKKFTDQWGGASTDDMIAYWSMELGGYSGEEIAHGLQAMDVSDWPPTLPVFKKLCRPPVDPLKAYYEAVSGVAARSKGDVGEWSHPAIYWAAMPLAFDLGAQTYSQIRPRWERALESQMEKGEWAAIPAPMLSLGVSGRGSPHTRESAKKAMTLLQATVVTKDAESKIDHKLWAKKIMAREARKDKSLTLLQVQMAREALDLPDEDEPCQT